MAQHSRGPEFSTSALRDAQAGRQQQVVYGLGKKPHSGEKKRLFGSRSANKRRRRSSRHHRRVWPIVLVVLLALAALVGAAGLYGYRLYGSAKTVRADANAMTSSLKSYVRAAKDGDEAQLKQSAQDVSASAHAMQDELAGGLWSTAARVPVYGSDVQSVRTLSDVMVDLADEGLVPLAQSTDLLKLSVLMQDSAVNIDAVNALANAVGQIGPLVDRSAATVEALPEAHIEQVAGVLETARDTLGNASSALGHANPLLEYFPQMLGAGGQTRTYLVLGVNNAEVHALGGFAGLIGTLTVTDGHIELGDFHKVVDLLGDHGVGSAGATAEEIALFGEACDTHHGDHNIIPDFSRVGQLYYNIYQATNNKQVDGVLSFDPVFLQRMLGLVGGIDTDFGVTVDGTNACAVMLNESLFWWDSETNDEFYKEVASKTFDKILSGLGSLDMLDFLQVIMDSAEDARCMMWNADENIENALKAAGFAQDLAHDPTAPVLGVYVSDFSVSKASYYLSIDSTVNETGKADNGATTYHVTTTFVNNAPRSLLAGWVPGYLSTNKHDDGTSELWLSENMTLIAPEGGRIDNIKEAYLNVYNVKHPIQWRDELTYQGLQTVRGVLRIDTGERVVLDYDVTCAPEATEPLVVRTTPVVPHEVRGD